MGALISVIVFMVVAPVFFGWFLVILAPFILLLAACGGLLGWACYRMRDHGEALVKGPESDPTKPGLTTRAMRDLGAPLAGYRSTSARDKRGLDRGNRAGMQLRSVKFAKSLPLKHPV